MNHNLLKLCGLIIDLQGPFCSYLGPVGLAPSVKCRLCGAEVESPEHLMYECTKFTHLEIDHSSLESLEFKARQIVQEIYKLDS